MPLVPATTDTTSKTSGKMSKNSNHYSPTSVNQLTIDVNSPSEEFDPHYPSPLDSKSKRGRRRRKGKSRSNQVEPLASPQRNNRGDPKDETTLRPAIIGWRSSKPRGSHPNSNRNNNHPNRTNKNKNWNHPSPRFNKYNTNGPVCPASVGFATSKKQHDAPMKKRDLYFALCVERVAIASTASSFSNESTNSQQQKAVARVTLTNWENEIVLDTFVVIPVPVTDFYETGIRPEHVRASTATGNLSDSPSSSNPATESATPAASEASRSFSAVRARVERMLRGKILIGYDLEDGLQALGLTHPSTDTRECSSYFPNLPPMSLSALEKLSRAELHRWSVKASKAKIAKDIPANESVVFANKDPTISKKPILVCVTTMDLYKKHRNEWETALVAQGRERERKQQDHLRKISQQRQQEQHQKHFRDGSSVVSIHCETVLTGMSATARTLARVTIVDGQSRSILMDEFCQIPVPVSDFCGTGITPQDIQVPQNRAAVPAAKPLSVLRAHVERLLRGRLLVGYKVEEDLMALGTSHPWNQIRDTAFFPPFLNNEYMARSTSVVTTRSQDELSEKFLRQPLRPMGDRGRPVDLCLSALGLYEAFSDQWENQDIILRQGHSKVLLTPHNPPSPVLMMPPPSPSTSSTGMTHSPGHQQTMSPFFGQQRSMSSYGTPAMASSASQDQHHQHHTLQEHQSQEDERPRSNSSSWFSWGKHQAALQQYTAPTMLSSQAFQALQENSGTPNMSSSDFLRDQFSMSSYACGSEYHEGMSRYDAESERSMMASSEVYATESVVSSLADDASNFLNNHGSHNNLVCPSQPSSSHYPNSSSWFLFGSKKSKYAPSSDNKNSCETMAAVQESEVFTENGLPLPTTLFAQDTEEKIDKSYHKSTNSEKSDFDGSDSSTMSPSLTSRKWFGFRKSPSTVPRNTKSPSLRILPSKESPFEDLSISAQPEGLPDSEAAIEITLSIPTSTEESGENVAHKSDTTNLPSRQGSSSWFGFRRSSKSSSIKGSNTMQSQSNSESTPKDSVRLEEPQDQTNLLPAPTERTAAMEDDWLQEVMTQSTGTTQDLDPWFHDAERVSPGENVTKPSSTSRGQTSWFGFKRPKATTFNKLAQLTSGQSTSERNSLEPNAVGAAANLRPSPVHPISEQPTLCSPGKFSSIALDVHNENITTQRNDEIFRPRARLHTESTLPSITTEEHFPLEGDSFDSTEAKDFDLGAAQSFNFLRI